jgi:hypothetical protein
MATKIANAGPRVAKREHKELDGLIFNDDLSALMRVALHGRAASVRVRASQYLYDCYRVAVV